MKSILSQINGLDLSNVDFVDGQKFELVINKSIAVEETESKAVIEEVDKTGEVRITVKKYMTEKASPSFDFMKSWNNDTPMPLVTMQGTIEKETRGMYYMNLHGHAHATTHCMVCGRTLTHPVSLLYGIGPECGKHCYINPFDSKEELMEHIEEVRNKLVNIKWSGWVIKSAIKEMENV